MSLEKCQHNFDSSNGESCPECLNLQVAPEIVGRDEDNDSFNPASNIPNGDAPAKTEAPEGAPSNSTSNDNSKIEDQTIIYARDGATIKVIKQVGSSNSSDDGEFRLTSLYKDSVPITVEPCEKVDIDVRQYVDNLIKHRILIFGDSGDGYANSVAKHIFSLFEVENKENVRLLRIVDNKGESPGIDSLCFERTGQDKDSIQEVFVIIDASKGAGSISFADSLLNPAAADIDHYPSILRENKFYIICLLKSVDIENWINKDFKRIFPLKIFEKKAASHQSEENVDDVRIKVKNIFNSEDQIDFLIMRTVCFIAAFFPNLSDGDFNELVSEWLKLESVSLDTVSSSSAAKETTAKHTALDKVWRARSHYYCESCFLIPKKDRQDKQIIDFKSEEYRKQIKEKLESYHWAFVEEKVNEIRKMALIFNTSNSIADQSMSLYVNYIPGNEEKLLNWLLWVFDTLNAAEKNDANLKKLMGIRDADILSENEEITSRYFYYKRLEEFFRKILHKPDLNSLISIFIERLLNEGCSQSALKIVKRLKSASGFNEIWWFKQIYERGDKTAKKEIKKYFFRKIVDSSFEDAVDKLSDWLPAEDAPAGKYSEFNKMALNLLVEYYSYLTEKYDEKLYGIDPTQFALFDFEDKKTAEIQIDKIIRYLLHPANLKFDLNGISYEVFVAMLLEIWNKILCQDNFSKPNFDEDKQSIGNKEIINIILEKVILYSDKEFQENIKSFWKKMSEGYRVMKMTSKDWETSEKFTNDYELIENLTEDFTYQQWMNQPIN
jgi:hypothetical protein